MFGLVRKKTYEKALQTWGEDEQRWRQEEERLGGIIAEKDKVLTSTEREKVLADLELALNLIQAYQRALSMISASDPNIIRANALLEKWGKKGDPHATYLGATSAPTSRGSFAMDPTSTKSRWDQEEEFYGDEAYGTATVRVEAEPIDEGEDKEPGYTRARIRFVDVEDEEPEILTAAKATTSDRTED